jgi:hypothetical protein
LACIKALACFFEHEDGRDLVENLGSPTVVEKLGSGLAAVGRGTRERPLLVPPIHNQGLVDI